MLQHAVRSFKNQLLSVASGLITPCTNGASTPTPGIINWSERFHDIAVSDSKVRRIFFQQLIPRLHATGTHSVSEEIMLSISYAISGVCVMQRGAMPLFVLKLRPDHTTEEGNQLQNYFARNKSMIHLASLAHKKFWCYLYSTDIQHTATVHWGEMITRYSPLLPFRLIRPTPSTAGQHHIDGCIPPSCTFSTID